MAGVGDALVYAGLRKKWGVPFFLTVSTAFTMGFVGVWILVAMYVSTIYNKAIKEDKIVC